MPAVDRRSGRDRRKASRVRINMPVEWEGQGGRRNGTLSDLSREGCFVLSPGSYAIGERVFVHFPMLTGGTVRVPAEIREVVFDIGFAARFTAVSEVQREFLERFVELNLDEPAGQK